MRLPSAAVPVREAANTFRQTCSDFSVRSEALCQKEIRKLRNEIRSSLSLHR